MAKSYKRELSELGNASGAVASNAGKILADAARLAARYSRDEIAPRARNEYSEHLVPLIASGLAASRRYLGGKVVPAKRSMGFGGFVLAGIGVALVAGVAYVAWQTLRTDDGAWTNDDFDVD